MIKMSVVFILAAVVLSYLLGSISFGVIFSKLFSKKDVREYGSGSSGMTNVMRAVGVLPGLLTFLFDALKGVAACVAAKYWLFPLANGASAPSFDSTLIDPVYGAYLCGLICMVGHMFPLFFGFKGGKGVAVSVGIFAVCCPKAIIAGLLVFIICVLVCKIVSLSSLIATVTVGVGVALWHTKELLMWPQLVLTVLMCALVFIKHKDNIVRLIHGEEKRLVVRKGD